MDASRRPRLDITSDAALDLQAPFAGYGYWAWEPGSGTILYGLGPWSTEEMTLLHDAAALELHTMTIAIHCVALWVQEWWPKPPPNPNGVGPFTWIDVRQVADNQAAAAHMSNREHASGSAERHLLQRRSRLLRQLQIRTQSHTVVREALSVQAADHLSKNHVDKFKNCINQLFNRSMSYTELPAPPEATRSLAATIKFARATS
jgi:hypothetical protein